MCRLACAVRECVMAFHEAVQHRLQALGAREHGGHQLDRGELARLKQAHPFGRGREEEGVVGHGRSAFFNQTFIRGS